MEQHSRDLRQRLIGRRNLDRTKHASHHDLRSRSRSTEGSRNSDESERRGPWHRRPSGERRESDRSSPPPRHRNRKDSDNSSWRSSSSSRVPFVRETDPVILARRQKQLDYGRNTLCYQEYIKAVPKQERQPFHPRSPVKFRQTSRRRWDSAVKNWRIHLHYWNDPVKLAELRARDAESVTSEQTERTETPDLVQKSDTTAASTPEPPAGDRPLSQSADLTEVKQEPREGDLTEVKQEREEGDLSEDKQEPREDNLSGVKQEPELDRSDVDGLTRELTRDKPTNPVEEPDVAVGGEPKVAVKEEPEEYDDLCEDEPEDETSYLDGERSLYLEEHADDEHVDWADDLEGLASELAS